MRLSSRQSFPIKVNHLPSTILLSAAILSTHFVAAATGSPFVLVDLAGPQLYPLFGILPYPASIPHQLLLAAFFLLSALTFSYFRHIIFEITTGLANMLVAVGLSLSSCSSRVSLSDSQSLHPSSSSSPLVPKSKLRRKSLTAAPSGPSLSQAKTSGSHYAGLVNTGNTCFFNSVIQSLASVRPFTEHVTKLICSAEQWDVPTPAGDALLDLMLALNTPASRRSAVRPSVLTDALSIATQSSGIRSLMTAHQQQDAHELLVLLLDVLSKERSAVLAEIALAESHAHGSGLASILGKSVRTRSQYLPNARRELFNPFEALVAQRTACLRCRYYDVIRNYVSEELSINVLLQRRGSGRVRIEDCLDSWAGLEGVEWRCWHCTLKVNLNKAEGEVQRLSMGPSGGVDNKRKASLKAGTVENGRSSAHDDIIVNGDASSSSATKLTASAKKRLKEVRKTHAALSDALANSTTEEEFRALHASIRLVAPPLPPPSSSGSVITATKQTVFSRPPQTLVIHLNRSMYYGMGAGKNNTQVCLREYLDLAKWCISTGVEADATQGMNEIHREGVVDSGGDHGWARVGANGKSPASKPERPIWLNSDGDAEDEGDGQVGHQSSFLSHSQTLYRLDSIVVHYGGHSFGHYVSFRRRPRGPSVSFCSEEQDEDEEEGWLRISDDCVTPVSLSDVLAQNAFLVFYHRVRQRQPRDGEFSVPCSYASPSPSTHTSTVASRTEPSHRASPHADVDTGIDGITPSIAIAQALSKSRVPRARSLQRWELSERLSAEPSLNGKIEETREEDESVDRKFRANGDGRTASKTYK